MFPKRSGNRIEREGVARLNIVGVETNLVGTLLGFQFSVITPGRIKLDGRSPLRLTGRLADPEGEISVDSGLSGAVTIFDGVITVGYTRLLFDSREITNPTDDESKAGYAFLNFQGISLARTLIKGEKP